MTSRETLALAALAAGLKVWRDLPANSDVYERESRTITVRFNPRGEVNAVSSSDGSWFAQSVEGARTALGLASIRR